MALFVQFVRPIYLDVFCVILVLNAFNVKVVTILIHQLIYASLVFSKVVKSVYKVISINVLHATANFILILLNKTVFFADLHFLDA